MLGYLFCLTLSKYFNLTIIECSTIAIPYKCIMKKIIA